jgi:hypothetical protein
MKKLILSFTIILFAFGCKNEQKQADKLENRMITKITTVCQPTPDQQSKIKAAVDSYVNLRIQYKHKYSNDQDSMDIMNKSAKNNYINTLKTILSPEQVEKLQAANKQEKEKQSEGTSD